MSRTSERPHAESPSSAPRPDLILTIFPDLQARDYETLSIHWGDLPRFLVHDPDRAAAEKKELRLFVPGEFDGTRTSKGSLRHDPGLQSLHAVILDYDEGVTTLEEAAQVFEDAGCAAVLAPTASWSKEKPKWRALIPLSRKYLVSAGDDLKTLHHKWVHVARSWGLNVSKESDTLSQAYYFGTPQGKFAPVPIRVEGRRYIDKLPSVEVNLADMPTLKSRVTETESLQLLEVASTGAPGCHEAMRRLSMSWISRGLDPGTVRELLKQALDKWGSPSDARWAERRATVDRLVEGAARKVLLERLEETGGSEELDEDQLTVFLEKLPNVDDARLDLDALIAPPTPDRMVVDSYLISGEAGGFVAPGGTGKTTLAMWEAIHILLGRPLYGLEVRQPGPILFISAEDRREVVVNRLNQLLRSMMLTKDEIKKVSQNFLVIDVSKLRFRLAIRGRFEVTPTAWVDALCMKYRQLRPSYVHLDPVSLLGPGEETGNDGMAEMMRAARNLGSEMGAAIRLVHHVSKEGVRGAVYDQYAGRGGSAFADNSRFIHQLVRLPAGGGEELSVSGVRYLIPESLGTEESDFLHGRVLGLFRHKLSYAELDPTPIFLKRSGFAFHWVMGVPEVSQEGRELAEARNREELDAAVITLVDYVGQFAEGVGRRRLTRDDVPIHGVNQRVAPMAVDTAIERGILEEVDRRPESGRGRPVRVIRVKGVEE
ncbi:MAG: AAA family ATPase [Deltaproteobacteria bacterium]|nr:AAA family ATPase [Deltaproteobacteria bacterium]